MLVTAYDMDIQGFIDVGSAAVTIHPSKPGQTLSVGGATVKDMHITDAELSHVTCASGFSVGNVITGDTVIFDITEASTEKTGSVTVRAEQAGAAFTFDTSPSTLSHGLNVYAMAGLTVSQDVTSKGANSTLSAGTGTLQVLGTSVLSTTDQTLTLTGDDVVFASGASVSSGTAATLLSTYCSSAVSCDTAIGVGSAVEAFHMSDTELAVVVAQGGLTIGGTGGGSISVSGVSSAGTAQIGTLALVATKSGNTVTFKTSASSFNKGIMVQAASGIVVSESVSTEASGSFFDAGAGTLTVEASMGVTTNGQHLVITADDVIIEALATVRTGVGKIEVHTSTADREIGIGATTKPLHLEDAELGRFSTTSGLAFGDSFSGSITVHGVTATHTATAGKVSMIATKAGKTVEFSGSSSTFSQGLDVAAAGVVLSQDVTSNGVSSLSAGTGTLTLVSGKALSTSGQALTLIADDMDFQGTQISSGAATLTIASFGAKTIGVGTTSEDLDLEASELGIIQSGGLIVGSAGVNLGIKVVSITEANSNGIAGTVTFLASSDDSQVVFTGGASTFYGVSAQADDGVLVVSTMTATGGSVYLDGDIENSGTSDTTNSVVFSHNTTVTSKLTMTLESSTGNIQSQGSLTLAAGTGIFIHDNFDAGGTFPLVINADYEVQGDGAITVSAGKTLKTYNGELLMTAFDLDLQWYWDGPVLHAAGINSGSASIVVHGAALDQSIGLGGTAQDMHVSDEELLRIASTSDVTFTRFGGGAIVVQSVSRKYSTKANSIVFGDPFGDVVTSKYKVAALPQVLLKAYATTADFVSESKGQPRLEAIAAVALGADIVVKWHPDIYSHRLSHKADWIGLYKKGACTSEDTTQLHLLHKCYIAWAYLPEGLEHGETKFTWKQYKTTGEYEARYFYGDSTDGQGLRCVTLGDTAETYTQCVLSARQISNTITVGDTGTAASMTNVPGLLEKFCDGSKTVCE